MNISPLNRNEKINGMIYTNYGMPPFIDTSTREGYYNAEVLKMRSQLQSRWSIFMSNLESVYDENKGAIRQLCEAAGDRMAGDITKVIIPLGFHKAHYPPSYIPKVVDELADQSNKPLNPGQAICNWLLGPKAKPFALPR